MEPPQQPLPLVVDIHLAAYSGEIVLLSSFCPTARLRRSVNVAEDTKAQQLPQYPCARGSDKSPRLRRPAQGIKLGDFCSTKRDHLLECSEFLATNVLDVARAVD